MGQDKSEPKASPDGVRFEEIGIEPDDATMRTWESTRIDGDLVFSGDCPRCGHHWDKQVAEKVMVMQFAAEIGRPKNEGVYVIQCNCLNPHPSRPDSVSRGCGAYWGIRVRRTNGEAQGS
jgi:hypothetical protein